jgi:hypothetical protein
MDHDAATALSNLLRDLVTEEAHIIVHLELTIGDVVGE